VHRDLAVWDLLHKCGDGGNCRTRSPASTPNNLLSILVALPVFELCQKLVKGLDLGGRARGGGGRTGGGGGGAGVKGRGGDNGGGGGAGRRFGATSLDAEAHRLRARGASRGHEALALSPMLPQVRRSAVRLDDGPALVADRQEAPRAPRSSSSTGGGGVGRGRPARGGIRGDRRRRLLE